MDIAVQERIARNDATFRQANEEIEKAALAYNVDGVLPFICECAAPTCTEVVRLTLDEYEQVRAEPKRFVNALGHHVNGMGVVAVVAKTDRYEVVEKIGVAGEVAEELDPRS